MRYAHTNVTSMAEFKKAFDAIINPQCVHVEDTKLIHIHCHPTAPILKTNFSSVNRDIKIVFNCYYRCFHFIYRVLALNDLPSLEFKRNTD